MNCVFIQRFLFLKKQRWATEMAQQVKVVPSIPLMQTHKLETALRVPQNEGLTNYKTRNEP